jgi:hypothetical protein
LSEQAKLTFLQEKIKDAKNRERSGHIFGLCGIILAVVGFTFYSYGWLGWSPLALGIIGVIIAIFGIFENLFYSRERIRLMRELERMATKILTCSKCGKQIPQGNYTFCPFCGSPLTPPPP